METIKPKVSLLLKVISNRGGQGIELFSKNKIKCHFYFTLKYLDFLGLNKIKIGKV